MPSNKSNFLDKVLGRIGRLDKEGLQTVVQRLARERAFLETLFNTIEDGVLVVDETGRVIYLNEAVTRLLGLQRYAAEGRPIQDLVPELQWDQLKAFDSEGGQRVVRMEIEVSFPRPRFLHVHAAPLDGEAAGSAGLALILHDATEARKETFEAIESERLHALTLLAASVAHEIGNPLNALHIHLQLMERELRKLHEAREALQEHLRPRRGRPRKVEPDPSVALAESGARLEKYLQVAKGEITRLDYIVTQFLQAIRPSQPNLQPGSLNDVVRETLNLLQPELENRGIIVEEKLDPELPDAPLDRAQLQQALVNLVKNAMQAMTRGGTLTLATGHTPEEAWVSVSDTGHGISQEQARRIFEPFYTTRKKGTGLGLMIVQRIVRDHGGRIELDSQVHRGTTFRIRLPLHERLPRLLPAGPAAQGQLTEGAKPVEDPEGQSDSPSGNPVEG